MKVGRTEFDGRIERLKNFEDTMLRLRRGDPGQQSGNGDG